MEFRMERLERELRFHRWLSATALLAVLVFIGLGATHGTPEVLRAERFEVVNRQGRPLVTLKTTAYGGIVQTLGNDGVSGVSIGASSSGGYVGVRDSRPTLFPRVELSTDDTGGMLAVRNWNGFAIEVDRSGLAVAHTREDGSFTRVDARIVLGVTENGGHIRVLNATGEEAAAIRADGNGTGVISMVDAGGVQRVLPHPR